MRIAAILAFIIFSTGLSSAQLRITPLGHDDQVKNKKTPLRIETSHLTLPFWDDFSYSLNSPSTEKWSSGSNVWVNAGSAISPPTLNIATFDGVDANGQPYSIDGLTNGPTDRLTTQMFDLSIYDPTDQLFISFYIQGRGKGEIPNDNDSIRVEFMNGQGEWNSVWSILGDDIPLDTFQLITIPVTDPQYFHTDFMFSFQSFGRQTGPFDTWNIDYVYFNSGVLDFNFPDRALQSAASSPFNRYTAVPLGHFKTNAAYYLDYPTATAFNLYDQLQPTNFSIVAEIKNYTTQGNFTVARDTLAREVISSFPDPIDTEIRQLDLIATDLLDSTKVTSDSLSEIHFTLFMNTDDNQEPDYVPAVYDPLDFRVNDTIRSSYTLQDFYSYDDGNAEFGAGLNYSGDMVLIQFPMNAGQQDTLLSLDIHFPKIGTSTANVVDLIVWNNQDGGPGVPLLEQSITVRKAEERNFFRRYPLSRPIVVMDTFYVGWRQSSAGIIDVGLDKNTNNGDRIFFNLDGTWKQNVTVEGSLMFRPRFGSAEIIVSTPEKRQEALKVYPNPSSGRYFIDQPIEELFISDVMGRVYPASWTFENGRTVIQLHEVPAGVYVLRVLTNTGWQSSRIVKR